jgi:hypothetical protein
MYYKFLHKGWAVLSKAPKYLNVALPDFSVQYVLASFLKSDNVIIFGKIPKASYVSLTLYNTYGLPSSSIQLTNQKEFRITIGKELKKPSSLLYVIIFRVYQPIENFDYPNIELNGSVIKNIPKSQIKKNSLNISNEIVQVLSRKLNLSIDKNKKFFLPYKAQMMGLFINPDAVYLIGTPSSNNVIKITGNLPSHKNKNIRFIGFMACNLTTTSTDSSIGWTELPKKYTIYVAFDEKDAIMYGYNPNTDKLLLWNKNNILPVIVYREVQHKHTGLFNLKSNKWEDAKRIMKSYYPEITHF